MATYYILLGSWLFYVYSLKFVLEKRISDTNILLVFFPIISLILIAGLRDASVGTDTSAYLYAFDNANSLKFRSLEFGFSYFNYLFHNLGINFQAFLIVIAFITISSLTWLIKSYSKNYFLSYYLYVTLGFYAFSMTGLRQSIAVSLTMVALIFLLRNKKISFLLLVAIASTFHISAIIFFLVPIFSKWKLSKNSAILFYLLSLSIFFISGPILNLMNELLPLSYILDYSNKGTSNPIVIIVYGLIPLAAIIFWPRQQETQIFSLLYIFSILNFAIYIISLDIVMISRLGLYFSIYSIILIPNIINDLRSKDLRVIAMFLVLFLPLLMFAISTPGNSQGIDKYSFGFW